MACFHVWCGFEGRYCDQCFVVQKTDPSPALDHARDTLIQTLKAVGGIHNPNANAPVIADAIIAALTRRAGGDAGAMEQVARLLCAQHGGDPDAVATDPHDCWDGQLWTVFQNDARAILAALALPAPVVEGDVAAACGRIQKWMDDEHRMLAPGEAGAGLSYDDVTIVLRAARSEGRSK